MALAALTAAGRPEGQIGIVDDGAGRTRILPVNLRSPSLIPQIAVASDPE
jgi:hypothetical protein